jgi:hypothetical protein
VIELGEDMIRGTDDEVKMHENKTKRKIRIKRLLGTKKYNG